MPTRPNNESKSTPQTEHAWSKTYTAIYQAILPLTVRTATELWSLEWLCTNTLHACLLRVTRDRCRVSASIAVDAFSDASAFSACDFGRICHQYTPLRCGVNSDQTALLVPSDNVLISLSESCCEPSAQSMLNVTCRSMRSLLEDILTQPLEETRSGMLNDV